MRQLEKTNFNSDEVSNLKKAKFESHETKWVYYCIFYAYFSCF